MNLGMKSSVRIIIGVLFTVVGCSPASPDNMIPPSGWTEEATQPPVKGIKVLFAGKRAEGATGESHLVVFHAPAMITKQNARGTIGAFLDGFWKKDPNLFEAIRVSELEIGGRHALFVRIFGNALNPPQEANWQTYFLMTEAGLFQVTYSSQTEALFRMEDFLGQSLVIGARESNFAREVIAEYVRNLPEIQAKQVEAPR